MNLLNCAIGKQVSNEAFLAITAIEQVFPDQFTKYIPQSMNFAIFGLKNWEDQ